MADDPVTCSGASLALSEPLAGSASTTGGYLLLEHGGPWGRAVLDDDTLPPQVCDHLRTGCAAAGLTGLLARRPDSAHGWSERPTVVLAVPDGVGLAVSTRLTGPDGVLSLDVPALAVSVRRGEVPWGWTVAPWLLGVCTHGRRDACCATLGRPVAARLAELAPERTWETSHLGGHRLAPGVLALPSGVLYGRVPPEWAEHVLSAVDAGRVLVDLVRGRTRYAPAAQVAELALRRATDDDRDAGVVLEEESVEDLGGVTRTTTLWSCPAGEWRVVVDTSPGSGPPRPASCGVEPTPAPAEHVVVEVTDVGAAGRGAAGWDSAHAAREVGDPHPLVVEQVAPLAAGTAVDIACGTGRHALWLAENGWDVTGLDFSRTGLEVAQAESARRGLSVDWQLGDARSWTPPVEGYDLVLMAFVQLPAAFARAVRWVRPGGRIVVVGHAVRNLVDGVGGPQDPRLLHDVVDLAARATGARLRVLRAAEVERAVDGGTAVDAVVVATRPAAG